MIIIFSNTKQDVDRYEKALASSGIKCRTIHGDKAQSDRNRALRDFTSGKAQVLIATDVAARGLDVSHIGLETFFSIALRVGVPVINP